MHAPADAGVSGARDGLGQRLCGGTTVRQRRGAEDQPARRRGGRSRTDGEGRAAPGDGMAAEGCGLTGRSAGVKRGVGNHAGSGESDVAAAGPSGVGSWPTPRRVAAEHRHDAAHAVLRCPPLCPPDIRPLRPFLPSPSPAPAVSLHYGVVSRRALPFLTRARARRDKPASRQRPPPKPLRPSPPIRAVRPAHQLRGPIH